MPNRKPATGKGPSLQPAANDAGPPTPPIGGSSGQPARSRRRRQYANDAEIDRCVAAARRHGLTPGVLTFHADGSVTVAQSASQAIADPTRPEETAYDRWKNRKAAEAAQSKG